MICKGKKRNTQNILVGKSEEKTLDGRYKSRWGQSHYMDVIRKERVN